MPLYAITSFRSKVTQNSWASERLEELGEQLESGEELPEVEGTEELLNSPPERVKELAEDVLSLNVIEVNQFIQYIQVVFYSFSPLFILRCISQFCC